MIRRLKKDVLDQLPAKRRQKIEISADQTILNKIKKIIKGMIDESPDDFMARIT